MKKKGNIIKPLMVFSIGTLASYVVGYGSWVFYSGTTTKEGFKPSNTSEKKVCYIADDPTTFYTSIEKALNVANSSATSSSKKNVVVIPSLNETDKTVPSTFISDIDGDMTVTIGQYVSLTIACTEDDGKKLTYGKNKNTNASGRFADSEEDYDTYIKSNIGLEKDTILKIEQGGSLNIGGVTGGGYSTQRPTGHTNGDFCQLTLYSNSKIECYGTMDIYGYIKENSSNNGSHVEANNGATINMPFVIYDFRGGSYSTGAATNAGDSDVGHSFPFNIYDFPNIQSEIHIFYGSKIIGRVQVYANSSYTSNEAEAVGANGLFRISQGGELTWKYSSESPKYSYVYDLSLPRNKGYDKQSKTFVSIKKGTMSLNNMSVKVVVEVATKEFFMPLCYKYDVHVENEASLDISEKTKFLSGSSLTIEEGASCTFSKNVVFYQKYVDQATSGVSGAKIYPQNLGGAVLVNNGELSINGSFGGFIDTKINGATLITGPSFSPSISNTETISGESNGTKGTYKTVTSVGYGLISSDDTTPEEKRFVKSQTYNSANVSSNYWKGDSSGNNSTQETISELKDYTCILPTTKVLMANGLYKLAKDIVPGDLVLVMNHETGQIEAAPIFFNFHYKKKINTITTLTFSNGNVVDISGDHGFFDKKLNKYIYLNDKNSANFIGHTFISCDGSEIKETTLVDVLVREELIDLYCPVSVFHLNYFVGDLLSMPGGIEGCFNIFNYDEKLKYDDKDYEESISKYGLMPYEECEDFIPEYIFDSLPMKYMKVAIGKGILTREKLQEYMSHFYALMK